MSSNVTTGRKCNVTTEDPGEIPSSAEAQIEQRRIEEAVAALLHRRERRLHDTVSRYFKIGSVRRRKGVEIVQTFAPLLRIPRAERGRNGKFVGTRQHIAPHGGRSLRTSDRHGVAVAPIDRHLSVGGIAGTARVASSHLPSKRIARPASALESTSTASREHPVDAIANPNKEKTTIPYLISIPIAEVRGSAVVETVGDEFIFIVEIGRGETAFRRHGQILSGRAARNNRADGGEGNRNRH